MFSLTALAGTLERAFAADSARGIDTCVVWLRSAKELADRVGHISHLEFPQLIEGWIDEHVHAGERHRIAVFSWILVDASAKEVIESVRRRRSQLDEILIRCLASPYLLSPKVLDLAIRRQVEEQNKNELAWAQRLRADGFYTVTAKPLKFRAGPSAGPIARRLESALQPYQGFIDPNWPTILVV